MKKHTINTPKKLFNIKTPSASDVYNIVREGDPADSTIGIAYKSNNPHVKTTLKITPGKNDNLCIVY